MLYTKLSCFTFVPSYFSDRAQRIWWGGKLKVKEDERNMKVFAAEYLFVTEMIMPRNRSIDPLSKAHS